MIEVVAVRAGLARLRESPLGVWRSAIEKHVVQGPARVHRLGILGDDQADRENHGGVDKAVLAYSREHYPGWQEELQRPDFLPGAVGENLEITGQSESDVCVGDTYRIGEVLFQVSQPRQPCWKPARLHGLPDLTARMAKSSRTGWYFRVLEEGMLEAPCQVERVACPHPDWTVERANKLVYLKAEGVEARMELAGLPELSQAWQRWLRGEE